MQYRVEIIVQWKHDKEPDRYHKGDIVRSRDVATVIDDYTVRTYREWIQTGIVKFVQIRILSRYWYLDTWREIQATTMDERDRSE